MRVLTEILATGLVVLPLSPTAIIIARFVLRCGARSAVSDGAKLPWLARDGLVTFSLPFEASPSRKCVARIPFKSSMIELCDAYVCYSRES